MRILVTQLPKIGYALKLPNNDKKKKKSLNFHIHIKKKNQIYQSFHNLMRQTHQEMNPSTAAALTTALVWSDMLDAMLVSVTNHIADQG